ncbi:MAG TPA: 3-deoxy-manno-octulosonate cytidylyltransferase [Sedimentisphaerales bacterium]|nr:3-deoxy-manno-octulosonate cytidylyltransferase [Sedimentisphaerales bacterium]
MNVIAVIPARYESSRFPGKVLAKDTGRFLIQHTYEQAIQARSISSVLIAADDERVMEACRSFGAPCVMTSRNHQSGTDRIAEAVRGMDADIVVNIQGDEPEMDPAGIDAVASLLTGDAALPMGTLVAPLSDRGQIADPNIVKVVVAGDGRAIYFSRYPIPYDRDAGGIGPSQAYLRHIGIYAYRKEFLMRITALPQGRLEVIEKLEQLRVLENGYSIMTARVDRCADGIDTREQYAAFAARYRKTH